MIVCFTVFVRPRKNERSYGNELQFLRRRTMVPPATNGRFSGEEQRFGWGGMGVRPGMD